ncbi:FAD-binding protein [Allokutzneria sp. A3M-2-11 16]|uniref:FAD-binding protein n=1 Tax=Allokutzneria sp. A3M-2-11 16 TaxID=2962043 RepID=UPI0020B83597|nr:FAD-binding protein [Allokutzneria sp. A3M-2-11 16]MCP3798438.1 FAD-binding protein [Allokutzneria sp. A3M-2-11 16]
MTAQPDKIDVLVVGAGPVGLLCALLGRLYGLNVLIVDKSSGPITVGRADALNARSQQLLEIVGAHAELHPRGKVVNTSSVWADGEFVSRQSAWWEALEGCFHKHFLMLGQADVEALLDRKVAELGSPVRRDTAVVAVETVDGGCRSTLSTGEVVESRFVIGADGSRSLVRTAFGIPFGITRPEIVWAVLDAVVDTDFPKVPEIIVFQAETSDVAWIPRERDIDRFYIRMDVKEFTQDEVLAKINRAMHPHQLTVRKVEWFSQFSVKESVAERFSLDDKVFLAGDAAHIHSVNGGQGLNTGLADAFNLMWKIGMVAGSGLPTEILRTYEQERKPVALNVVQASGALVRATKYSESGTHAVDYVKIVERRAGYITGMGIRYGDEGPVGSRFFDFRVRNHDEQESRIYSVLDYQYFTLLVFGDELPDLDLPPFVRVIHVGDAPGKGDYWSQDCPYSNQVLLVRPDSYIAAWSSLADTAPVAEHLHALTAAREAAR